MDRQKDRILHLLRLKANIKSIKSWEVIIVHSGSMKSLPAPIEGIKLKNWIQLLGIDHILG
jgi:hypothetical protein